MLDKLRKLLASGRLTNADPPAPGRLAAARASSAFTANAVFSLVTIAIMPLYTLMLGFPRCQLVSSFQTWHVSLVGEVWQIADWPNQA